VNEKVRECVIAQFLAMQIKRKTQPAFCHIFPVHKVSLNNRLPWLPIVNTAEMIIKNGEVDV